MRPAPRPDSHPAPTPTPQSFCPDPLLARYAAAATPAEGNIPARPRPRSRSLKTRNRLALQYLPLVDSVLRRFGCIAANRDDLRQDAIVSGLIPAIEDYRLFHGRPFEPYAARRIRGAVRDSLRRRGLLSRAEWAHAAKTSEAEAQLAHRLGRRPTTAELAEACSTSEADAEAGRTPPRRDCRLSGPHGRHGHHGRHASLATDDDGEPTVADTRHGTVGCEIESIEQFERLTRSLPLQCRTLLTLICLHGHSQADAAAILGLQPSTAGAMIVRARGVVGREMRKS